MCLRCCCLHIQLKTTLHIQWHKEPKLEEPALDSTTRYMSPQWSHSMSTPLVSLDDNRFPVSASVCMRWGRKGAGLWRKGFGKSKVPKGGSSADREELTRKRKSYPSSTASPQQHPTFPPPSQFYPRASPPKTRVTTNGLQQEGGYDSQHFQVKPKILWTQRHCYLGGDVLQQHCPRKLSTMT